MPLADKIKLAIVKQVLERGIFDTKRMMEIDRKTGKMMLSNVRSVILNILDIGVLHTAAEKLAGSAAPVILRTQGEESGRIDASKSWRESMPVFGLKVNLKMVLTLFPSIYSAIGWGKVDVTKLDEETGEGTLTIENCFEADAIIELYGKKEKPQCYFVAGYLKGFFSEIIGKKVRVTETKCKAAGSDHCEFQITIRRDSEA